MSELVVDVLWTADEAERHAFAPGEAAAFLDILRATTTMTAALAAGARAVVAVADPAKALALRERLTPAPLLAGEERMERRPGFDLGNSPREFTAERVTGRTLVMCTTNGTRAAVAALRGGCRRLFAASLRNRAATARALLADPRVDRITLICAGTHGRFSLDDAIGAGAVIEALIGAPGSATHRPEPTAPPGAAVTPPAAARPPTGARPCRLSDAAVAALQLWQTARPRLAEALAGCRHGRLLVEAGFAADLPVAAAVDAADFAIAWQPAPDMPEDVGGGWFVPTHFPGNRRTGDR
ncbi:2-phosphosulfolactate phosphatase [Thermaerobacter composti]|uniref:Probable 2-phosphosulfolactate phosphatase n=1 Tax=Thermaerobacter composti TaxID=554949 RepID=A0ABZ0QPX5_9FIRM|nr:2-phosphosulfolactate phosphatase [Thermaerobacter composti]WPD18812.1 2-phosphosulfolactate phosphatase [Thermaerobacter composti]